MPKCPTCYSTDVNALPNGQYKCMCCDSIFNLEDKVKSAYIARQTTKTSMNTTKMRGGEEVYENCINGVAAIECRDLGCCGSGFLIDNLHVVTNAHVVTDDDDYSRKIVCTIANISVNAKVVKLGDVDGMDIALLQIENSVNNFKPLRMGNSDLIKNGQSVYHIGNSLGEGLCITGGIISDKCRFIDGCNCIMTDVPINPGNSGGPLINENSEVIGVCVSGRKNANGMKYSIPINDAMRFLGR